MPYIPLFFEEANICCRHIRKVYVPNIEQVKANYYFIGTKWTKVCKDFNMAIQITH